MWFKRKAKTDPDSALTETLRSLQTLLEDEPRREATAESTPVARDLGTDAEPNPAPIQEQDELQADPGAASADDGSATDSEAASPALFELELNHDDPQLSAAEDSPQQTDLLQAGEDTESEAPSFEFIGLRNEDVPAEDEPRLEDQDEQIEKPVTADSIPILNNVVFEPAVADPVDTEQHVTDTAVLIEESVQDLNRRLKRYDLTPLDADQEQELRRSLDTILTAKQH